MFEVFELLLLGYPKMNLRELLSYQNPKMEEYDRIIAETKCRHWTCDTPLGNKRTIRFKKDSGKLLCETLGGKILVDLGCGTNIEDWEGVAGLAKDCGVGTYLGVDKFHSTEENYFCDIALPELKAKYAPMQLTLVCGDMLRFLAMLPSGSANFTINNIDEVIIPSDKYLFTVAKELERATAEEGIIFGASAVPLSYLSMTLFSEIGSSYQSSDSGMFVKKVSG